MLSESGIIVQLVMLCEEALKIMKTRLKGVLHQLQLMLDSRGNAPLNSRHCSSYFFPDKILDSVNSNPRHAVSKVLIR